jgi:hypothetical protein
MQCYIDNLAILLDPLLGNAGREYRKMQDPSVGKCRTGILAFDFSGQYFADCAALSNQRNAEAGSLNVLPASPENAAVVAIEKSTASHRPVCVR